MGSYSSCFNKLYWFFRILIIYNLKKIYLPILLFIIVIFFLLPIINIPVTSSSRGVIRSYTENTKLTSMVSGRIIKTSLYQNNQLVNKGDTLLVVTAEQLETQKNLQNNQASDYNAQLTDLNKLVSGNYTSLQTGQYQRELSAMHERIAQVNAQLKLSEKDFYRTKTLFDQGVLPQSDYDKALFGVENLKRQISSIKEQQIAQWQAQKREVERQVRSLNAESTRINQESKNYIITAPISGRLIDFSGIQKGNYIITGQEIGSISPDKSLVVETYVSPKDIGFIHENQQVKLQMDTYNYNQWGLLTGKVIQVDQNVTVDQQTGQTFFRVLCSMDKNFLQLKSGYKGNIEKGMTLTTRFHLIDRTLWQLLFDRVDDWFNPRIKE